jgi:pimeloyl-ACP methyl ester carboxylesterase
MKKENLVVVHSFPTNSILLSGLIEYLNDYFEVYFIDLPGFTREVPPLIGASFEAYSQFVEEKMKEFNLDSYLVGGISFGFTIINNIQHDSRCKGIIAMEPYIGPDSLRMSLFKSLFYTIFVKSVVSFNLSSAVWKNKLFREYLPRLRHYPQDSVDIIFDQIDSRTFFETANLIISNKDKCSFHDFPHVLLANKDDRTVNYDYIHKTFTENVKHLLVINTTIDHYPKEPTKAYFKEKIPEEDVKKILSFITSNNSS